MSADGLTARISRHITPDGFALVSPRVAHWLLKQAGISHGTRQNIGNNDPAAYRELLALHVVAMNFCTATGTKVVGGQAVPQQSSVWMTTAEAGDELGISDRGVRKRIERGKLPALKHGSRYLVNRNDLRAARLVA